MSKRWKSSLHCNERTFWTGFVCMWQPGRRLLLYSMKPALNSVVFWLFSAGERDLGERKRIGSVANILEEEGRPANARFLLFLQMTGTTLGMYMHLPGVISLKLRPFHMLQNGYILGFFA